MSSDIITEVTAKRGDIGVRFTDTLTTGDATFDFTGATAKFLLKPVTSTGTLVQGTATLDNTTTPGTATIHYDTDTDDLATAGDYYQEWEITKGGVVLTFPSEGYNLVHVLEDLNPA